MTYWVSSAAGICSFIFTVLIALLGMQVIIHRRSIKRQRLIRQRDEYFQQHGGQLLSDMMKIDCNLEFTLYRQEDIEVATN
uniref:OSIGBa0115J08.3 protein n=1 Tax=Oryza sativa TaxID=4530 RepID=Q01KS7_ORYSA|nr:OSIGBa0115J08.3 [Oryza sativa]CAH66644.1 OSIGBa0146I21.1 [Oryza sativa]